MAVRVSVAGSGTLVAWKVPWPEVESISKLPAVVGKTRPILQWADPDTGPTEVVRSYVANTGFTTSRMPALGSEIPAV
jgi:hypothetical protein